MQIGDVVEYVDEVGNSCPALITQVWDGGDPSAVSPSLNLVFISKNSSEYDTYGRQIARKTSVVHEENQIAHGFFWRDLD